MQATRFLHFCVKLSKIWQFKSWKVVLACCHTESSSFVQLKEKYVELFTVFDKKNLINFLNIKFLPNSGGGGSGVVVVSRQTTTVEPRFDKWKDKTGKKHQAICAPAIAMLCNECMSNHLQSSDEAKDAEWMNEKNKAGKEERERESRNKK